MLGQLQTRMDKDLAAVDIGCVFWAMQQIQTSPARFFITIHNSLRPTFLK